jgi:type III pantothenate kinase
MLLAVDIGNTQTQLGVFRGDELVHQWRLSTDSRRTADELALLFGELLAHVELSFSRQITGVSLASVVPKATQELREMTLRYFGFPPVVVEPGVKTGIVVRIDNPREAGADRIANAVAAHAMFPGEAVIVVDFGTAINFDVVTEGGEYVGGALSPGLESSSAALFRSTARLPRVELIAPSRVIGSNTVAAVQSGIVFGAVALVDGMVDRIVAELRTEARIIATGGLAPVIAERSERIEKVEPMLTLTGLRLIFERNVEERE